MGKWLGAAALWNSVYPRRWSSLTGRPLNLIVPRP